MLWISTINPISTSICYFDFTNALFEPFLSFAHRFCFSNVWSEDKIQKQTRCTIESICVAWVLWATHHSCSNPSSQARQEWNLIVGFGWQMNPQSCSRRVTLDLILSHIETDNTVYEPSIRDHHIICSDIVVPSKHVIKETVHTPLLCH